jgi:hypothetical protein
MRFAAAKFAADRGDVAAEIDHLDRANRLMAGAFPYGFEADLATARELAGDWPNWRVWPRAAPEDPVLFVTGLPRSGTTLAETILAAHPEVTAGARCRTCRARWHRLWRPCGRGEADPERFAEAADALPGGRAAAGGGAGRVIADKAISTFSRIGHAAAALPGARFVLRRDPRDTGPVAVAQHVSRGVAPLRLRPDAHGALHPAA